MVDPKYAAIGGKNVCLADLAEEYGVPYKRLWERLSNGMPVDRAISREVYRVR